MSDQPGTGPDPIEDAAQIDDADMTTEMTPVPHEHGDAKNEESGEQA